MQVGVANMEVGRPYLKCSKVSPVVALWCRERERERDTSHGVYTVIMIPEHSNALYMVYMGYQPAINVNDNRKYIHKSSKRFL